MTQPKFRPGDIVQMIDNDGDFDDLMGKNFTIHANTAILKDDVALCEITWVLPAEWFELVFRPASREETEALRRLASVVKAWGYGSPQTGFEKDAVYEALEALMEAGWV